MQNYIAMAIRVPGLGALSISRNLLVNFFGGLDLCYE